MLRPVLLFLPLILIAAPGQAGEVFLDSRLSAGLGGTQTGFRLGGEGSIGLLRAAVFLDADIHALARGSNVRVMDVPVLEGRDDGRYYFGPGIGTAWRLAPGLLAAVAAGTAYGYGCPDGTAVWAAWAEAGLRFPVGSLCHWGIVYEYRPVTGASDHRAALQLRFRAT